MKVNLCDKCGKRIDHPNRVHVYNYTVRKYGGKKRINRPKSNPPPSSLWSYRCREKKRINRPKRDDFDLCYKCRIKLIKWIRFS